MMIDGSAKGFGDGRWSLSWKRGFLNVCLDFVRCIKSHVWVGLVVAPRVNFKTDVVPLVRLVVACVVFLYIAWAWFFVFFAPLLSVGSGSLKGGILFYSWLMLPVLVYQLCDKVLLKRPPFNFAADEIHQLSEKLRWTLCWRFTSLVILVLSIGTYIADNRLLKYDHLITKAHEDAYFFHDLYKPHEDYLKNNPEERTEHETRLKYLNSVDAYHEDHLTAYEENIVGPHRWVIEWQNSDYEEIGLYLLALVSWLLGVGKIFFWILGKERDRW